MSRRVIAIGLDAADPARIEQWMNEGHLPTLARLRDRGTYARLQTFRTYRAETPWTTFLTGAQRQRTGYWTQIRFRPDGYRVENDKAYDFHNVRPWYEFAPDKRVCIFDVPHARLSEQLNGVQVTAWGAHSPQTETASNPPGLIEELAERYGMHPLLNDDNANVYNLESLKRLHRGMLEGIRQRTEISLDLLSRERFDLFLTVYGEPHVVGHYFWHFGDPDHPLYDRTRGWFDEDPNLEMYRAIDAGIGRICEAAGEDADVIVFAAHGMGPNNMDLTSLVFLPELLYRRAFPGKAGMAPGVAGDPHAEPIPIDTVKDQGFARTLWNLTDEGNFLRTELKRRMPLRVYGRLEKLLGQPGADAPISPFVLREQGAVEPFQPSTWYRHLWPQMRAFALPSFSEGYVRLNVRGRESQGLVDPADFARECEEITAFLQRVTDGRTGAPLVKEVIPMRDRPDDGDPNAADADLVVLFEEDHVSDVVDSPDVGRIGPVPMLRSGSHRADGFVLAAGPQIGDRALPGDLHSLDLAPTILGMLSDARPEHLEGRSLFE